MCVPQCCATKITEAVRRYAAEHGLSEEEALGKGLQERAREFTEKDSSFKPPRALAEAPAVRLHFIPGRSAATRPAQSPSGG
jgi:hypothetical protein